MDDPAILLTCGTLRARFSITADDLRASQGLRRAFFPGDRDGGDRFDDTFRHVLLEDARDGRLMGSFRVLVVTQPRDMDRTYSAQHYDLTALTFFPGPVMEVGRFCLDPASRSADLLRLAWGAITRLVDRHQITLLFGCASFSDTDPARHAAAFARLGANHVVPERWRPGVKAHVTVPLTPGPDPGAGAGAMAQMPPLLRTYLGMGGWVSDHAVIDRAMGTMHVFTGVEIAAIPPARARLLRAIAGTAPVT